MVRENNSCNSTYKPLRTLSVTTVVNSDAQSCQLLDVSSSSIFYDYYDPHGLGTPFQLNGRFRGHLIQRKDCNYKHIDS